MGDFQIPTKSELLEFGDELKEFFEKNPDQTQDLAASLGFVGGNLLLRRMLRKRGATEAQVLFYSGVLGSLAQINRKLDKIVKQTASPATTNINQTFPKPPSRFTEPKR